MSDLISRQTAINAMQKAVKNIDSMNKADIVAVISNLPSVQPDRGLIEQIRWERDTAIQQLKDLGYGLGEKPRTDGDTISRQAAITLPVMPKEHREYQTHNLDDAYEQGWFDLQKCIEELPSAQPDRTALHDLLQDAIDAGIITETQASRLMDMIVEDNT